LVKPQIGFSVTGNIVNEKKDKNCSMCLALLPLIIIKPGPGLIQTRNRIPGFMDQPEKIKKKSFNISYKKIHINIDYTYYEV
jgi:hypothetical protein